MMSKYQLIPKISSVVSLSSLDSDGESSDGLLLPSKSLPTHTQVLSHSFTIAVQWLHHSSRSSIRLLRKLGIALLPSFVHQRTHGESHQPERLHAFAALDGIRGFACFFVFIFHLLFTYGDTCQFGYGYGEDNYWIHQLPILRLVYSGHAMVAIFFVLSGYVLSHKPLKMIRSRLWNRVLHTVTSSTFRRALRLYLPTVFSSFVVMLSIRIGVFRYATEVADDGETLQGTNEEHPEYFDTFYEQFWDWASVIGRTADHWSYNIWYNHYDPHLWTIPVEFRSSIVLFGTIIALAKSRAAYRLTLLFGFICFCVWWDRWEVTLFLAGMFIAEIDLILGIAEPLIPLNEKAPQNSGRILQQFRRWLWIAIFVVGLYLASSPNMFPEETPGYRYLTSLVPYYYTPKYRFWPSIGGVLIIWSVNNSKHLQPMFTNSLAQYLGRISYAFYIVHGPILHSLGYSIMPTTWKLTGKETIPQYCLGFFLGFLVILPVVFWTADVFWRFIDIPSVKFARWVETKMAEKRD